MDKTAIKKFSIWARSKLIADIIYKAGLLGITEEGIKDALPQSTQDTEFYDIGTKEPYAIHREEMKQRKKLVSVIRKKTAQLEYKDAYQNVIEEVAYTWFNRLIAIRFMEVNDYMPAHIRVLSSESGTKLEPDLVTTPFDAEIEFTQQETEYIIQMKNDNQVDALFRFLFIKQCNELNTYLPKLFEKTSDYTELLLNVSVTDQDGIVYHLTHDIKEDDFNISNMGEDGKPTGQVEIIGWMYQYYNTEPKDETFALLKSNVKITKERIPAATQLFTPDWIVRYMVENSVGRLWLEGHENEELKRGWKYYLDEAEQEADVEEQLKVIREEYKNIKPEEIKVIDPCMGSGHILVYAFDILMQVYESCGYSQRDAAKSIVENNIYGLDIDDRAFQLAYFAIMMKARSYSRRFLTLGIVPNLCAIQESNGIQYDKDIGDFLLSEEHRETLQYLLNTFVDAKEYGSILNVKKRDYDEFLKAWELIAEQTVENIVILLWYSECSQIVPTLAKQAKVLSQKYDVVVTNPPYMGISNGNVKLNEFVKKNFPDSKSDLFAIFIERCGQMIKENRYQAMITQHAWMFLSSFEKLRAKLQMVDMINMAHLGARAFEEIGGEVVQTTSFVIRKSHIVEYKGMYCRLIDPTTQKGKEEMYLTGENRYTAEQNNFTKIPGNPVAYWLSEKFIEAYNKGKLVGDISFVSEGIKTGNNEKYLRLWYEVPTKKFSMGKASTGYKWYPHHKGGDYRKWYGNLEWVIDWENDGDTIKSSKNSGLQGKNMYFHEFASWSKISSKGNPLRYFFNNCLFDSGAPAVANNHIFATMGLFNGVVGKYFLSSLSPTLNLQVGDVKSIPLILNEENRINKLVKECIDISKEDWDSFETSWDFKVHPLVGEYSTIKEAFGQWETKCNERYNRIVEVETELNRIYTSIYEMQKQLSIEVNTKEISIYRADLKKDIKSLLSYALGCIFGRYSSIIEKDGSIVHKNMSYYLGNIIPLTDKEYFKNDIVTLICNWIKDVYGEDYYEENITFIANALQINGGIPNEVIRNYFINDFYADHCKMYSTTSSGKRPIYWLFDSGKQNGFKALIYMHRYNADTIGNLRVDYLHRMERIYESEINRMQDTIDNSSNAREVTAASKRKEKLQKQLKECQEYDEKIGHLALSRIEIDLDDGVKVNYEKVQIANDGKKYQVLAKI